MIVIVCVGKDTGKVDVTPTLVIMNVYAATFDMHIPSSATPLIMLQHWPAGRTITSHFPFLQTIATLLEEHFVSPLIPGTPPEITVPVTVETAVAVVV
jgi:hypothetical protein